MRAMPPLCVLLAWAATSVPAQTIRDQYLAQLPPVPKMVSATRATERFQLFGDTSLASYRDDNFDGIDDQRAEWLKDLAAYFAPIMRRNNFSLPRDFEIAAGGALHITRDDWRDGKRVRSDTIRLGTPSRPLLSIKAADSPTLDEVNSNDRALLGLLQAFAPRGGELRHVPAEADSVVALFIDFPGSDQRSWRRSHRDARDVATYVHPFIDELDSEDDARFALVLQFWFFYPFNDGANNHEGDWEHLNVVITAEPLSSAVKQNGRLTAAQLTDLIENRTAGAGLSIAFVEYYFHETFTTLNYVNARSRAQSPLTSQSWIPHIWSEPDYVDRVILDRMRNPLLATHPVAYIGGNNRGPDEFSVFLPRFGAAYNRNSHGSYPFPGTWQSVGPMLATEKISGRPVPELAQTTSDTLAFRDPNFMLFHRSEIVLVPDWERVDRLMEHQAAREQWAWLVLPLRWGFPVSTSLGGGLIPHTDVGQVSPEGPAYQPTWNRLGYRTGWREFKPQTLRVLMVPTSPAVYVKNGWGVLNVPLIFMGAMPGWSVALTQAWPWVTGALDIFGAPPAKTYYPGDPPFRFSSIGAGFSQFSGGAAYARLLSKAGGAESSLVQNTESTTPLQKIDLVTEEKLDMHRSLRLHMNLFYGRKISAENSFAFGEADLRYKVTSDSDSTLTTGTMAFREFLGGFRLNAWSTNDDEMQFYTRVGYGYNSYTLKNVFQDGQQVPGYKAGYGPTLYPSAKWWPNTWYIGAGTELFTPKKFWLLGRLGVGARLDFTMSWHALYANKPGKENLGWVGRNEVAFSLLAAW